MTSFTYENLSEYDLRSLVKALNQLELPIFLSENGKILFANPAWTESNAELLDALKRNESVETAVQMALDKNGEKMTPRENRDGLRDLMKVIYEGGEYEFAHADGSLFKSYYSRIDDRQTLGVAFDITELKHHRENVVQTKRSLEATLDGLNFAVLLYGPEGDLRYFNHAVKDNYSEMLFSCEIGAHFRELHAVLDEKIRLGFSGFKDFHDFEILFELDNMQHDLVTGKKLHDGSVLISIVDISDVREKEKEVRETRKLLEQVIANLPYGVTLFDTENNVIIANDQTIKLNAAMGLDLESGEKRDTVFDKLPSELRSQILSEKDRDNYELNFKLDDGRTFRFYSKTLENTGQLFSTVEVTELMNLLDAAKAADKAKSSFLANMSHEIRTPMNGVMGMTQILEQSNLDAHQQNCINIIQESSESLLRIINDILDVSKLEVEKITLDSEPFDLSKTARSAVEIIKPDLRNKPEVSLSLYIDKNLSELYIGDKGRVRQILINLLSNAVKFTSEGHVKLSVLLESGDDGHDVINIRVEDTGIGIPDSKRRRIFNRFEQADNSTTRKYGGTGLGLAITNQLVRLMDGEIKVISEEGQGSTFEIKLVLEKHQATPVYTSGDRQADQRRLAFIVDDDLTFFETMKEQFQSHGITCQHVASGESALKILGGCSNETGRAPLVIYNYNMPDLSGLDFLEGLRLNNPNVQVPIYMVAAPKDQRENLSALGVLKFFNKPKTLKGTVNPLDAGQHVDAASAKDSKIKILVADDDVVNQKVFEEFMTLFEYDCTVVANGLEAVEAFTQNKFDAVLMDITMPVLDGMEACRDIRIYERLHKRKQVPIIAVTAHALKGDQKKFLDCGMNDYLPKPILRDSLKTVLDKWINASAVKQALAS